MVQKYDVAIIGAGASGVMTALEIAKQSSKKILIIEKNSDILLKLKSTGNGRCNFTNRNLDLHKLSKFYTDYDGKINDVFLSSKDIEKLFCEYGIPSTVLESKMVYPFSMSAKNIVNIFKNILSKYSNIDIVLDTEIKFIEHSKDYILSDENGVIGISEFLVMSTGGRFGITKKDISNGYNLAKMLGHNYSYLYDGICAIDVVESDMCHKLSGVKTKANILYDNLSFVDDVLFTDTGISGIGTLKISNLVMRDLNIYNIQKYKKTEKDILFKNKNLKIGIDFLYGYAINDLLDMYSNIQHLNSKIKIDIKTFLYGFLDTKIVDYFFSKYNDDIFELLHAMKNVELIPISKKKNYSQQLTCGGIILDELHSNLESKIHKKLYFSGEILNVQGICGGYNLHFVFSSAVFIAKEICNYKQ